MRIVFGFLFLVCGLFANAQMVVNAFDAFPTSSGYYDPSDDFTSTNLKLWLDASETDWKTGGSQDYLVLSGSDVTEWTDRSGNGNDATEVTIPPTYIAADLNGQRVVSFGGTDKLTPASTITDVRYIAAVFSKDATSGNKRIITSYSVINNHWWGAASTTTSGVGIAQISGTQANGSVSMNCNQYYFSSLTYNKTNFYYTTNDTDGTTAAKTINYAIDQIGFYVSSTYSFEGELAELIIIDGTDPTSDQIDKIQGYLHHKWGLTVNLDAGHPYKSVAP
jgi:hypothetical protein